jgi:antitoxin ParD1/3/4
MANTSLTLGSHWDQFIKGMIKDGRYGSASELVRESLRLLEERELKLRKLRQALVDGEASGMAGPLDMEEIKRKARSGA